MPIIQTGKGKTARVLHIIIYMCRTTSGKSRRVNIAQIFVEAFWHAEALTEVFVMTSLPFFLIGA